MQRVRNGVTPCAMRHGLPVRLRACLAASALLIACGDRDRDANAAARIDTAAVELSRIAADSAFADSVLRASEDIGASVTETALPSTTTRRATLRQIEATSRSRLRTPASRV